MGYVAPVLAASTRIWMGWAAAEAIVDDAILPCDGGDGAEFVGRRRAVLR